MILLNNLVNFWSEKESTVEKGVELFTMKYIESLVSALLKSMLPQHATNKSDIQVLNV